MVAFDSPGILGQGGSWTFEPKNFDPKTFPRKLDLVLENAKWLSQNSAFGRRMFPAIALLFG